jgi:predicted MFS family arabinose efflux permease
MIDNETLAPPLSSTARAIGLIASAGLVVVIISMEIILANALPIIQRELDITPAAAASLLTTLAIVAAVMAPILGKIGDRFGAMRVVRWVIPIVVVGGILSAIGSTFTIMMLGSILQGVGGGLVPLFLAVVPTVVPPERVKVAIGGVIGLTVAGSIGGVILTMAVAEGMSWRWLFGIPSIAAMIFGIAQGLTLPRDLAPRSRVRTGIDWAGTALFAFALIGLMAGIARAPQVGWLSVESLLSLALVVCFLTGWLSIARRHPDPLVDLRMLRTRGVWTAAALSIVTGWVGSFVLFLIPQLLAIPPSVAGFGFGASLSGIGAYVLPGMIISAFTAPVAGLIEKRLGARRTSVIGVLIMIVAIISMIWLHSEPWHIYAVTMVFALGFATVTTVQYSCTVASVPSDQTGVATGLNSVGRAIGFATGSQVSAAVITVTVAAGTKLPTEQGFELAFGILAGIAILGMGFAIAMPGRSRQAVTELREQFEESPADSSPPQAGSASVV